MRIIQEKTYLDSSTSFKYPASNLGNSVSGFQKPNILKILSSTELSANTKLANQLEGNPQQNLTKTETKPHKHSISLESEATAIFWNAREEAFEDGMESNFSKHLHSFIKMHQEDALEVITCLVVYEKVDAEIASEALRQMGHFEEGKTYEYRRWLLERSLTLPSARIRDGAMLGLASMDDKHAIPYLQNAIALEQCSELKNDMKQVLDQLES
jgi:hypothetical protein